MGRSRRENIPVPVPVTNTQDPATSGEAAATATLDQNQGIDHGMSLLQQAHAVFIHEGNNIVGEKERMAELYQEEKDAGAKAQDLESRAERFRIVEAKKKEERLEAESRVKKFEEKIARAKEYLQEMMNTMD